MAGRRLACVPKKMGLGGHKLSGLLVAANPYTTLVSLLAPNHFVARLPNPRMHSPPSWPALPPHELPPGTPVDAMPLLPLDPDNKQLGLHPSSPGSTWGDPHRGARPVFPSGLAHISHQPFPQRMMVYQ